MRDYEQEIEISISSLSAMDSRIEQEVKISMRDRLSGELLGEVRVPASVMWALLQGGIRTTPGTWSPKLHRVGKRMRAERVALGRAPSQIGYKREDQEQWAQNKAREREEFQTAESYDVRATNAGWDAVYRWWEQS